MVYKLCFFFPLNKKEISQNMLKLWLILQLNHTSFCWTPFIVKVGGGIQRNERVSILRKLKMYGSYLSNCFMSTLPFYFITFLICCGVYIFSLFLKILALIAMTQKLIITRYTWAAEINQHVSQFFEFPASIQETRQKVYSRHKEVFIS